MNDGAARGRAGSVRTAGASLRITSLSKRYEGARSIAVADLSLDVAAGEFVTLLGASGSGKTTTLMVVAGFTAPDDGDVVFDGRPMFTSRPKSAGSASCFRTTRCFPYVGSAQRGLSVAHARLSREAKRWPSDPQSRRSR